MLLFACGADHLGASQETKKWTAGSVERNTTVPRSGIACWSNQSDGGQNIQYYLGSNYTTLIMGCAFRATLPSNHEIFSFLDATTHQVTLRYVSATGVLRLERGNSTATIASGTTIIANNTYYYVELKATIGNSAAYEVRLNEDVEMSGTADTQESSNSYANRIQIFGLSTAALTIDDIYLCDDTDSGVSGAPNNDFLGDVIVDTIMPNGNGNSSQFVGSDANSTDNYLLVDETTPNDDTDYVESGTVGNKDTYAFSSMVATTGEVFGVQVLPYARKTSAGGRKMKSVSRLSGVESDGAEKSLNDTYLYYPDIRESDPSGAQWTIANVNAAEFGPKVTA